MQGSHLRHLAVIAGGPLGTSDEAATAALPACGHAAAIAVEAFAAVPGLRAFSFLAPGIDRLLADPAGATAVLGDCVEAAALLEEAAARCGASLRICGRGDGLPVALGRHADRPAAAAERTLLWFLRYRGREEIARAAGRFFRNRPGSTLGDDDLDAWLDTAGVPDPDLVVLSGGAFEARDALVWQASYAELWHTAKPWAAFTAEDLRSAVSDYATRQRRFGG
jgi:hypothetical protein